MADPALAKEEQPLRAWTSDQKILDRMRAVVMAANRLEHRSARPDVSDREILQLRRELTVAATAYEELVNSIGWQLPAPRRSE